MKCECGLRGIEHQYHHGDEKEAIAAARAWWNARSAHESLQASKDRVTDAELALLIDFARTFKLGALLSPLYELAEIRTATAAHEPPDEPIGFVARAKADGTIFRDFAKPGEQHTLTDSCEWMPVYARPAPPPGADVDRRVAELYDAALCSITFNLNEPISAKEAQRALDAAKEIK